MVNLSKYNFRLSVSLLVTTLCASNVLAQAIVPLSYSPERAGKAHQMWHFGQVHAVSDSRFIFNSGHVDLALMDARTGKYLKQLDTIALYQFVDRYVDTSTHPALQPYQSNRVQEDSIDFSRFQIFDAMSPIPGSTDVLVQASVTHRPTNNYYPWGVVEVMLRVDTALNIVGIRDLVQDWRPSGSERVDSVVDRRLVGMLSENELFFYEPDKRRRDTLLRRYRLEDDHYVPVSTEEPRRGDDLGEPMLLDEQVTLSFYNSDAVKSDSFFISTPSGKTLPLDTLQPAELGGHRYFDVAPVVGRESIVLLTGKPDERGYVASKTLSLFNVATKKYELLGTYEKAKTKAYGVSVRDGVAYVLLYDDRRNRPLLHKVELEAEKVFGM